MSHYHAFFKKNIKIKFGLQNGSSMDPTILKRNGDIISVQFTPIFLALKVFTWYFFVTLSRIETIFTMNVHEIMIGCDLTVKKKNLPSDPFFKSVIIKESRRRTTSVVSNDEYYE